MLLSFFRTESKRAVAGSVAPLFAFAILTMVIAVGASVDMGRLYMLRTKAQQASDAALLGAVSTSGQTYFGAEYTKLFNANFPAGYMGATINSTSSGSAGNGLYTASVTLTLPMTLMAVAGADPKAITVNSEVTVGAPTKGPLELAIVMDNTESTSNLSPSTGDSNLIVPMKAAANSLIDTVYKNNNATTIYTSSVPYSDAVKMLPSTAKDWLANPYADSTYFNGCMTRRGGRDWGSNNSNTDLTSNYKPDDCDTTDCPASAAAGGRGFKRYFGPLDVPNLAKVWFYPLPTMGGSPAAPVQVHYTISLIDTGFHATFIDPNSKYGNFGPPAVSGGAPTPVPLTLYRSDPAYGRNDATLDYIWKTPAQWAAHSDLTGPQTLQSEVFQIDWGTMIPPSSIPIDIYGLSSDGLFPEDGEWRLYDANQNSLAYGSFKDPSGSGTFTDPSGYSVGKNYRLFDPRATNVINTPYRIVNISPGDDLGRTNPPSCPGVWPPFSQASGCMPPNSDFGVSGFTFQAQCGAGANFFLSTADAAKAAVNSISTFGSKGAATDVGMSWGWYALSPRWRRQYPAHPDLPFDYKSSTKVAVIMAHSDNIHWQVSDGNTRTICSNMRAAGISIYAVSFLASPSVESILRDCAPGAFYIASDEKSLNSAFSQIASSITYGRMSLTK
ncbi:hypothetical protein BH10PLA2_BH10PLA2_07570 [soil metagenome]